MPNSTPVGAGGGPQTTWAPVGTLPLSDAQAAALVTRTPEQRPDNVVANDYVPSSEELARFHAVNGAHPICEGCGTNPLERYVDGLDGMTSPSTGDLIQWGAHKWGIPEDWLRAQYINESNWHQSACGDKRYYGEESAATRARETEKAWYEAYPTQARLEPPPKARVCQSMGITQVKWKPNDSQWPGTEPLRWKSTAFNIDFQAAQIRYYYDGDCGWCRSGYSGGQEWNSIGAWYEPTPWVNAGAQSYIARVQKSLEEKPWLSSGF